MNRYFTKISFGSSFGIINSKCENSPTPLEEAQLPQQLKETIYSMLAQLSLSPSRIRGQGYDGASNMRGHIHGLRTLIQNDCSSAHYVHCFAHQLQLTLVKVAHKHVEVESLIDLINLALNTIGVSYKRRDEF